MSRLLTVGGREVEISEEIMGSCPEVAQVRARHAAQFAMTVKHFGAVRFTEFPDVCAFCLVRRTAINKNTCGHEECVAARDGFAIWANEHPEQLAG